MKLLFLLISTIALAQQQSTKTIPLSQIMTDCSPAATVTLDLNFPGAAGSQIIVTQPPINNDKLLNDQCPPSTTQNATGNVSITLPATTASFPFPQMSLIGTDICNGSPKNANRSLCVYNTKLEFVQQYNYTVDTTTSKITITSLTAGNKRITVNIKDDKGLNKNYLVCYGKVEADVNALVSGNSLDCGQQGKTILTNTTGDITGLDNDVPYFVIARVSAGSLAQAPWSDKALSATPVPSESFTSVYDGVPSPFSLTCSQSSPGPANWIFFLGVFVWLGRRLFRNRMPACAGMTIIIVLLAAPMLFADLGQMNFGLTGVVYRPSLNASTKPDGSNITMPFYRCMYNDKQLPLMGVEVDWHLVDDFGSLQLGFGAAYTYAGGFALKQVNGKLDCSQSADSVGMHLVQLKLPTLTYMLDAAVDQFPLVPYFRVGTLAMGYLFNYQGSLDRKNLDANKPVGFVFGWEAAAGLMLCLNFLEPRVAKAAKASGVYDHVYLKAEIAYMPINNFGAKGLDFSPAWPTPTLPLMLTFGLVFELQ